MYVATFLEMLFKKLEYPFKVRRIPYKVAYWTAAAMELASKTILLGREPLLTRFTVELLAKNQTLDITAAREELGYQPRISVEQGLEIFACWWKEERQK
jgi:nucleoside-diphosphate-sugar epimerase